MKFRIDEAIRRFTSIGVSFPELVEDIEGDYSAIRRSAEKSVGERGILDRRMIGVVRDKYAHSRGKCCKYYFSRGNLRRRYKEAFSGIFNLLEDCT